MTVAVMGVVVALCGFTTTLDPDQAEIVTTDVTHFWRAFDDAAKVPMEQRAAIYAQEYFAVGSPGLKDIIPSTLHSPELFSAYVEKHRDFYGKVRLYIRQVVDQKPAVVDAYRRLKALYPDIKFPQHVYFVVGQHSRGGTSSDDGIILGAEMYTAMPGTPYSYANMPSDIVPFKVLHETVHFNQTVQPEDVNASLLQNSVLEGMADFIASLVLPQPTARQYADRWQYGCAHEAELAARFLQEQGMTKMEPWMYTYEPGDGWAPDMGYWIGYRIDQAYYDRAADKTAALRAMLQVTNFKALLKASGYPAYRTACEPVKPGVSQVMRIAEPAPSI
ncbi:MAG TPA: DUF2268 domain-containing putative Zn-dependent protease [Gammaproteobacteria bacterium]|nr:DUF2268 domain-containing putative Zn-dependent protease [Gammaproteobacteria bacterium]